MTIGSLQGLLKDNGIVGAGGAGFPSYAKLDERVEIIILNCSECEPLLNLHKQLLASETRFILDTLDKVRQIAGAQKVIIGVKQKYITTIGALNQELGDFPAISLHMLKSAYPVGDEVQLIYDATGRLVKPGKLPIDEKVIVYNVETIYNIGRALAQEMPVIDKLVTITGEVTNPVTVRVPIGCSIAELVAIAGNITVEEPCFIIGGPMMGRLGSNTDVVTKTTNAVIVLSRDHPLILKKQKQISTEIRRAASACCQCQTCTELCPRHALGYPVEPHKFMRGMVYKDSKDSKTFLNMFFCSMCGLCEMYSCPQGLSPRTLIAKFRSELKKEGIVAPKDVLPNAVSSEREYRFIPSKRLTSKLGLSKYDVKAPLDNKRRDVSMVKVLLSQHIGMPSLSCVNVGDDVTIGQKIGEAANGLSVAVHAPISGTVEEITQKWILIRSHKKGEKE